MYNKINRPIKTDLKLSSKPYIYNPKNSTRTSEEEESIKLQVLKKSQQIAEQIENFFTLENLNKDIFLRNFMDLDGWVNAKIFLSYNKIKKFRLNLDYFHLILRNIMSKKIEIKYSEFNGCKEMFIRNRNWENIKEQVIDVDLIKSKKINFLQNEYLTNCNLFLPFNDMKPMKGIMTS